MRLWVPIRNLTEKMTVIQTSLTSYERIADVLDEKSRMTDPADANPSLTVAKGAISFDNVVFTYPGKTEPVLRGISFDVAPGKMLALVGDTGAGKTTIVQLLSRFYDVSGGTVVVDGHDVREYTLSHLRSGIALVPQDVVIFAGSVRDNVTLGKEVDDQTVWRCLDAVRAGEIIRGLDGGLDHELEEGGRTLSTGQRQLLSFARALVYNPPVLVLDEATANVDTQTESAIQEALRVLTAGRTSVVIAHRLSTIREADEILVLRNGAIVERGSHDVLLERGGEYSRLHRMHLGGAHAG
jgi:ATP-binding cassette subfamily B protein